jgi:hypothetical protein
MLLRENFRTTLICLTVLLGMVQGGCAETKENHKWIVYEKDRASGYLIRHKATAEPNTDLSKIVDPNGATPGKPIVDENDQIHVLVTELQEVERCKTKETDFKQPPASRVYSTAGAAKAASTAAAKDASVASAEAEKQTTTAAAAEKENKFSSCLVDVRDRGGKEITYQFVKTEKKVGSEDKERALFEDSVQVRELYRFRIMAGPVFSTLQKKHKKYSLQTNSAGQKEVVATAASDTPANFALLLKAYIWERRDVLADLPECSPFSNFEKTKRGCLQRFNPVIGINFLNPNPLQNFYAGVSFEPVQGVDIVGGVHCAKTQQLADGFSQGQVITTPGVTDVAKKDRFNNGWFVGVTVDVGVVGTWFGKVYDAAKPGFVNP